MNDLYDVIVAGAGPAGSLAARAAARSGSRVLLLEKDREIGVPVRCAEGVGAKGLSTVVEIDPRWIDQEITGVVFHSPSGLEVKVESAEIGYVLNRKRFDADLAHYAAKAGADIWTRAYVSGLHETEGVRELRVLHLGRERLLRTRVVIGADGIESRIGRWAGLETHLAMKDVETCAQVTASGIDIDPAYCHFYFSSETAPGGYLWIFPKGGGIANVGLGISGDRAQARPPMDYLREFMKTRLPGAAVLTTVAGGVPCAPPMKNLVSDGVMLAGDAAHQSNPISGGGIVNAMIAGEIAGEVAAAAAAKGDVSAKNLSAYPRRWQHSEGGKQRMFYRIKEFIYKMTDQDLDRTAEMLLDMPLEKRTLLNIFKSAIIHKPSLLLDVVKVFT